MVPDKGTIIDLFGTFHFVQVGTKAGGTRNEYEAFLRVLAVAGIVRTEATFILTGMLDSIRCANVVIEALLRTYSLAGSVPRVLLHDGIPGSIVAKAQGIRW